MLYAHHVTLMGVAIYKFLFPTAYLEEISNEMTYIQVQRKITATAGDLNLAHIRLLNVQV